MNEVRDYDLNNLFDPSINIPESINAPKFPDSNLSLQNTFSDGVSSTLDSNQLIGNTTIEDGFLQSNNFVSGSTGWQLTPTSAELNVSTALLALDIPDTTTTNSFHVDSTGNAWWGAAAIGDAVAKVLKTGVATFTNVVLTGLQAGSAISTTYLSGTIPQANLNVADRGWVQTCVFSVTDADTITWGAGTFTSADGTAYSIGAGNTGNMSAKTYIYLDIAVSTTAYQTTTTATTAVGVGKVLVAIAQNGTGEATYKVLSGQGGENIDAANIVASSITSNELAASSVIAGKIAADAVTATEIDVATLSAIAADMGAITAGTIVMPSGGLIRSGQTAYDTGTGFFIGNVGGTPQLSIGVSTGNKLLWDGAGLEIKGKLDQENISWNTMFESLDGFSKRPNSGTIAFRDLSPGGLEQIIGVILTTAATNGNTLQFFKNVAGQNKLSFDADARFRADIMLHDTTNQTAYITCGSVSTSKHFGFKIVNNEVFGSCADGTTQSLTAALTTFTAFTTLAVKFEARLKSGSIVEFKFIDRNGNEFTDTLDTNLPTGAFETPMYISLQPNADEAKVFTVQYWDFWNAL